MATAIINAQVDLINSALNQVNSDLDSLNSALGAMPDKIKGIPKTDGYYEQMTVGNAEQLVSNIGIEDSVPYNFRTAGGSVDIGNRETDMLIGGSVAWNQYADITATTGNHHMETWASTITVGESEVTIKTTRDYVEMGFNFVFPQIITANHKYISYINIKSASFTPTYVGLNLLSHWSTKASVSKAWSGVGSYGIVYSPSSGGSSSDTQRLAVRLYGNSANNDTFVFNGVGLIDLTAMFGSTIADYIYSLEQSTAGAGVAWFKKLFPKPYYAYNAGELIHVNASAHKMVGFNQWDEEWESGSIDATTGQNESSSSNWRSKNYVPILPNTTYFIYGADNGNNAIRARFYDASKTIIPTNGRDANNQDVATNRTFLSPTNAYYIRFAPNNSVITSKELCINLHWDGERDGEYEPYEAHNYALDSDLVLRGIPKLDSANRLYYDGDTYESDGKVTRKYGIVDLGTLSWSMIGSSNKYFQSDSLIGLIKPPVNSSTLANAICEEYKCVTWTDPTYESGRFAVNGDDPSPLRGRISFINTNYTSAAAFKTAMSGVYLVYELATPTEETADPYTNPQICSNWGTEEYVVTEQSGVAMPVGHDTFYQADLKAKLEMLPDSPDGDGDYIVRQTNGENAFIPYAQVKELPDFPTTNGNYKLRCTVSGSSVSLSWVAE